MLGAGSGTAINNMAVTMPQDGTVIVAFTLEGENGPKSMDAWPVIPGKVQCRHLTETKLLVEGAGLYEGEVKSYLACDGLNRRGHWIAYAGHSYDGWMPPPFPLAQGAVAASTVATLRSMLKDAGLPHLDFRVEFGARRAGNRTLAQTNAAEGRIAHRPAVRRTVLPGSPATIPLTLVRDALLRDPLSRVVRQGGILKNSETVVV